MKHFFTLGLGLLLVILIPSGIATSPHSAGGLNFTYPYPVHFYHFSSQQQNLTMAYMDIQPSNYTSNSTKGPIVLFHGKNFCGATWNETVHILSSSGYRVIVPDQIGFCKSSKPVGYQFTFMQLATNTNNLLHSLQIVNAIIMGHSMGGMLAARYALMFPGETSRLLMVDPLGLENWFALGVPYQTIDVSYQTELATTYTSIQSYQQSTYYGGTWNDSYDIWVSMLLSVYKGPLGPQFAYNMAQTTDMIFTQPTIYEIPSLKMDTALFVGDLDNTAIGKAWAPANVKPLLGHYDVLGPEVAAMIKNCTLFAFEGLGHAPQIQDPVAFHGALIGWLG